MVDGGNVACWIPQLAIGQPQAFKGLGACDFVDEVQVHIEEGGLAGRLGDNVLLPDFFEHGAGGRDVAHGFASRVGCGFGRQSIVRADGSGGESVWCAVGVDEEDAGDVLERGAAGGGLGGPAGDAANERGRQVGAVEGAIREDPHAVGRGAVVCGPVVTDPVDRGEDEQRLRAAEVAQKRPRSGQKCATQASAVK